MKRRTFLARGATAALAAAGGRTIVRSASAAPVQDAPHAVLIEPRPLFDLSPYLYMQFMEPLGTADGSVAAAWDYHANQWRGDVVARDQGTGARR